MLNIRKLFQWRLKGVTLVIYLSCKYIMALGLPTYINRDRIIYFGYCHTLQLRRSAMSQGGIVVSYTNIV